MTLSVPAELDGKIVFQGWSVIDRSYHRSHICHKEKKLLGIDVRVPRVLGELVFVKRGHVNSVSSFSIWRSSRQYVVDQRQEGTSLSSFS